MLVIPWQEAQSIIFYLLTIELGMYILEKLTYLFIKSLFLPVSPGRYQVGIDINYENWF